MKQRLEDDGTAKIRCLGNHAENENNDAAQRRQTVPMSSVAMILLTIRVLGAALEHLFQDPSWFLPGATEDLKAACRQVPLSASNVAIAIAACWSPVLAAVQLYEMWGQPFGAGHAAPNFYR